MIINYLYRRYCVTVKLTVKLLANFHSTLEPSSSATAATNSLFCLAAVHFG